MQTQLDARLRETPEGQEAEAILRKCVHCGFCNATCPTYQLLGDERDGPRGRIYLIKQVLEGQTPTRSTQQHLDRCLTCRNCESTCPSGVQYGHLLDIGRALVEQQVPRPAGERLQRWALREGLNARGLGAALSLGRRVRGMLPHTLRSKLTQPRPPGRVPTARHARQVLLLSGCVQPHMAPNIQAAVRRVLDAAGISALTAEGAGCCGALRFHLNDTEGALTQVRALIDAWWPWVEAGQVEALVMDASGCGVMVKDYGHLLRHDPVYRERAARISAMTRDLSELLPDLVPQLQPLLRAEVPCPPLVFHPPCTLQHGQCLRGGVESGLRALGFSVRVAAQESHLCCGAAGTYSVLQSQLSESLRARKLMQLAAGPQEVIISANMGCVHHLQAGASQPVQHWIEALDDALQASQRTR